MGNIWRRLRSDNTKNKSDELLSNIRALQRELVWIILPSYGLLDALLGNAVLTDQQYENIKEKSSQLDKVKQLVEEITKESHSNEKLERFMETLNETHHKHVYNFIRGKGLSTAESDYDDWPLRYVTSRSSFHQLISNKAKLTDLIDSRNGLLDKMFSANYINERMKLSAEACLTDAEKTELLLMFLFRGGLVLYNNFIRCLLATKQHQVVSLLAPEMAGDAHPLSDEQQSRLQVNYATITSFIDPQHGLVEELWSCECITQRQREYIVSATTQTESSKRLVDIVRRGSETDFYKFIKCLHKTGQHLVCRLLLEDGVVAQLVATLDETSDSEERERFIADILTTLLHDLPDERRDALLDDVRQRIDKLRENEATMVAARTQHSIALYYFCTSLAGLRYLEDNGTMKALMQDIFILLLRGKDSRDLRLEKLAWNLSNINHCFQEMFTLLKFTTFPRIYRMAERLREITASHDEASSLSINDFPYELIEMILIRSACRLFATINRMTPRAEVYTLATLSAVTSLWWETFTYRKFNRRQLKRYFRHLCHPFKCTPRPVTGPHISGDDDVIGVAESNNKLFITCRHSNTVQVFESSPPFSQLENMEVQGLKEPSDIVACRKTSQLYIADFEQCAVWRVKLMFTKQEEKFVTSQWRPFSISVNSGRLLVTPWDGDSIFLYDDGDDGSSGNEPHRIQLPQNVDGAYHAVETTRKTFIVCHDNRFVKETHFLNICGVTEVDFAGKVIHSFDNRHDGIDSVHITYPYHLALDNNHVIVADFDSNRIVLLKSDLQFERVLVNLNGQRPRRVCLTSSRLLIVTYRYGRSTRVDVFAV